MNIIIFSLILLTVVLNTAAQLALKIGIDKIGIFAFTWSSFLPIGLKVILSPWIILGIVIYAISVGTWLMVLSRAPVSIAYPMSSLGYIMSAIAAYYLLGENLTLMRIAGVVIILIGVYMVARG